MNVFFLCFALFFGAIVLFGLTNYARNAFSPKFAKEASLIEKRQVTSGNVIKISKYYLVFELADDKRRIEFSVDAATYANAREADDGILRWQGKWFQGLRW